MLTTDQYSNVVLVASRANSELTQTLRQKEAMGCYPDWNLASCQGLKIKSGVWSLSSGDINSVAGQDIYYQLLEIGASFSGGIQLDPNYQPQAGTIIIDTGGNYNVSGPIFFNTNLFQIVNYQNLYFDTYGNYPEIDIFTGDETNGWQRDTQTDPIMDYNNNDPTQALLGFSISYPVTTSGYIVISGKKQS